MPTGRTDTSLILTERISGPIFGKELLDNG